MNIKVVLSSVIISAICSILALLQFTYLSSKNARKRHYDPFFLDLIPPTNPNYFIDYIRYDDIKSKAKAPVPEKEVEHCLKAAFSYKLSGKLEKALKLFEHAAQLAPNNPDVLTKYGEFLEQHNNDVISADELYFKALSYEPNHNEALANHKRTSYLVDQLDLLIFRVIDEKRNLLKGEMKSFDFETKKKALYLHIYHTVGIEGNTLTFSQLQYLLETGRVVMGKSIIEHNEVLGLEIALQYVKLLSTTHFIELDDILEIHKRVIGHANPLAAGVFRDQQVYVGSHVPPPPEKIEELMIGFVNWLNSEENQNMHPVRFAALAHYKLVDIHPFMDGNGRTSRLIMNLILLRTGYPPVIIYKEDRHKYYEYLNIANTGDVRPFVRFIAYCTDETLNTYLGLNGKLDAAIREIGDASPVIQIDGIKEVKL